MSSGQQPSTVNLSNLYSKHPLYVDSLQQSLFSGNGINQPQNRSNIEAGESLMHFKPTELPMYSKNPITSFPNLLSNYITGSLGSSTENFSGEKLNGQNYFSWSQSIKMFLEGRHQFDFLTGGTVRPLPGDALERLWKGEDSLIRSMLINSMEPQIDKPLLSAATAKDLWDTTQTLYSKRQNASRLYTLRKQVHNCKQGTLNVTTYFNKLSLLWKEMDLCRETVWDTPNDDTQYAKLEEVDRVYDFLARLNPKFDTVCGRILGQRPLPSLMEVCFEVRLEEDRTNAMGVLLPLPLTPLPLALGPQIMTVTRIMGSQFLCVSTARNNGTPRISVGNSTVVPQEVTNGPPTRNRTQDVHTLVRLPLPAPLNQLILLRARPRLRLWVPLLSQVYLSPLGLLALMGRILGS